MGPRGARFRKGQRVRSPGFGVEARGPRRLPRLRCLPCSSSRDGRGVASKAQGCTLALCWGWGREWGPARGHEL